jgi:glutathione S-transferase
MFWFSSCFFIAANSHGAIAVTKKLGLEAEGVEIVDAYGKTRTPEFLAFCPAHLTPVLELGDGTSIWESCALMKYLCSLSDKGDTLYPKDAKLRARLDMVMDWRNCTLTAALKPIGYVLFGFKMENADAQAQFKELLDDHFKLLTETFLKDTKFVYSDTPTIADLSIAPALTFIKARSKFWDATPDKVKEYHAAVLAAFPETKENFDMLDGMATGFSEEGIADLAP